LIKVGFDKKKDELTFKKEKVKPKKEEKEA
jgi:hypothetical protein